MSDRFQFSQSKVKKWRQCHYCYHCRYVEKLTKKIKSRPLQFGTIVHEMLEAEAKGDEPFEVLDRFAKEQGKLFTAEKEMYGDIIEDVRTIMSAYFDYYEHDSSRPIRYNHSFAEHWLEVPIGEDLLFVMQIDELRRTKNKLRWITEHKTFSRQPNEDDRWRNLQSCVYIKACQIIGMRPFDGMLWNYIKSKPPKIPAILKDGSVSIKAIDTLPSVVKRVLLEQNIKHDKNAETLMDRARKNFGSYFFRVFAPIKSTVVEEVYRDFLETAREMMEFHGKKTDRNIGMHCGWCDYEKLCRATLTGGDVDFLKEKEYEVRKKESKDKGKKLTQGKGKTGRRGRRTESKTG